MYDVAHGEGLAVVLPAWLSWFREREPKRVDRFTKKLFKKTGDEGVVAFEWWLRSLGLATRLGEIGIKESQISYIAENVATAALRSKIYKEYDKKTVEGILKRAL